MGRLPAVAAFLLAGCGALPEAEREAPKPGPAVVSVVGSSAVAPYARALAARFARSQRDIEVRVVTTSSSAAPPALVADLSAIGMMSRPIADDERDAVARKHGRAPVGVRIAMDAIGIYVFRDNPVQAISLSELERVYGGEPRAGAPVKSWGELGATGAWAARPVVRFGLDTGRGAYEVMRELVLGGGAFHPRITAEPVSTSVVQAVAMEQGGVGYASVYFRTARTRMLAVRGTDGKPVAPTEEAIAAGDYALARPLYFYFNLDAGPATQQFLRFVRSDEGRQVVRSAGGVPPAQ